MKRFLSLILIVCLILTAFAGCTTRTAKSGKGKKHTASTEGTTAVTDGTSTEPVTGPTEPVDPEDGLAPLMWKVTGQGSGALYLFGTIHAGDERNEQVLEKVTNVLSSCDALAVEFDTVAYEKDTTAAALDMLSFLYTDGTTVKDHLPADLLKDVKALLKKANMNDSFLEYYNAAMWSMLVEQAAMEVYSELQFDYGMDTLLINRAYELEIPVWDVESAQFQYGLMNEFSDELYALLIRATVEMGEEYGRELDDLYEAWTAGDLETLTELVTEETEDGEELTEEQIALLTEYNTAMLDDRNLGMAEKAEEYLAEGKTVFFAVGAAHMLGDAGVVQLMRDAGYTVEQYNYR